ncbi:MAG: hypothetical protein JSR17_07180 [Proteobacteria bacterium]|nr:hypothetical protein [Pseudomonadota bacterium]
MLSYSIKLHVQTSATAQDKQPIITPKETREKKSGMYGIRAEDKLKVDINLNIPGLKASGPLMMMQMDCTLRFKNKQEFIREFSKAIDQFERDERVASLKKSVKYQLEFSFLRVDFVNLTPDFVVEGIQELLVKTPSLKHIIPEKNAALSQEQKSKLAQAQSNVHTQRKQNIANHTNLINSLSAGLWFSVAYILFSSYLPEALAPYVFFGGLSAILAKYALYKLLDKHAQHYEDKEVSARLAKTKEFEAYEAGKNLSFHLFYKHWRHPLAFLAGKRMSWMTKHQPSHEQGNSSIPKDPMTQETVDEKRNRCYEAALKRFPVVITSDMGKKPEAKKQVKNSRRNQKRVCRK